MSNSLNFLFEGIDHEKEYLEFSKCRKREREDEKTANEYKWKTKGVNSNKQLKWFIANASKQAYSHELVL